MNDSASNPHPSLSVAPESTIRIYAVVFSVGVVCSLAIVTVLAVAMFLPIKFVHPVRTERWRAITLPVALAWTFFAGWAAWVSFDPQSWAHWGLILASLWLIGAGAAQQAIYGDKL